MVLRRFIDAIIDPNLLNLKILGNMKEGQIIACDHLGKWYLTEPSAMKSAVRTIISITTNEPKELQRTVFIRHASKIIEFWDSFVSLLFGHHYFTKPISTETEIKNDVEYAVHFLKDLYDTLDKTRGGLQIIKKNVIYQNDINFITTLESSIEQKIVNLMKTLEKQIGSKKDLSKDEKKVEIIAKIKNSPKESSKENEEDKDDKEDD